MEGTTGAKKRSYERSGKKSLKGHKQKRVLETDKENAEGIKELPDVANAVPNVTGSEVAQVPFKKKRKKKQTLEDVETVVQGSRENTQDNDDIMGLKENTPYSEQHGTLKMKKHRKSKVQSSDMTSVQEKKVSEKDESSVQGDGKMEVYDSKKPSYTTWVQTASWKSLVGETGRVTFSLGSMLGQNSDLRTGNRISLTGIAPAQPSMDLLSSNDISAWIEDSSFAPLRERPTRHSNGHSNTSRVNDTQKFTMKSPGQSDAGHVNPHSVQTLDVTVGLKSDQECKKQENADSLDFQHAGQIDDVQSGGGEVCRFMRSENYEQEWLEAKRAVKDIFKRTRKDALRSMKMFHKKSIH